MSALAAAPLLGLAACSTGSSGSDASDGGGSAGTRTVTTPKGDVEVPTDPQRIVVLNYALAGYLYDLGIKVSATTTEASDSQGSFSEMWGDAPKSDGTQMLSWTADGFDLEAVLKQDPDLIIAGGWGFPYFQADKAYDDLTGIAPTVLVDKAFTNWEQQFSFLAEKVFDKSPEYEKLVAAYKDRVAEVRDAITVPPQPISLIYVTPEGTPYLTLDDYAPEEFAAVGFEIDPIASKNSLKPYTQGGDSAELSTEKLGELVTSPTVFISGFNQDTFSVEDLEKRAVWKDLPAFAEGHAYDLPYWISRHDYDEALALLDLLEEKFTK
ncbi:ABC transporter substrate-binding protein [Brachybacterium sp. MASK1Z-5]|uniref:ABC transporter substrate-binding protein n=1 Tax=Brachybacterium halotolerans TaxID=2795215 RepID=A0ABS1BAH9_9MICO|nr:ABC transporter substrate-binding protein [Brachybacterium halotolerans]